MGPSARLGPRDDLGKKGAQLRVFPPESPNFKSVEGAFSKLKALLRKASERTFAVLRAAIGHFVDVFTPQECANHSAAAGSDAD